MGIKEFGLFMDHLGSTDYLHDFNLKIPRTDIERHS